MAQGIINTDASLPFCKGCGHTVIGKNTEKAILKLGLSPLDVILVTDIGCHGLIDKSFNTHTVHGLHGRSVALAAGISAGLMDKKKKVIVFLGDGGATIGMQHLLDAAHNGFNMTVVVHNNMLYGMTGGQPSEFTPKGFKTPGQPEGSTKYSYDICGILASAGASYVRRLMGVGDFSDALAEAFAREGFSLVEVMEICPSYGVKANPEMKLSKVIEGANLAAEVIVNKPPHPHKSKIRTNLPSLISEKDIIEQKQLHCLKKPLHLMLCGSAGEGTQLSAELIANTAIRSGLNITKKSSYPVTVGIGFSSAEVILSPGVINYTGTVVPDYMIITSADGLDYGRAAAKRMKKGILLLDESLELKDTGAKIIKFPFREKVGGRNSSFMSIFYFIHHSGILPIDMLASTFIESKISKKIQVELFLDHLPAKD